MQWEYPNTGIKNAKKNIIQNARAECPFAVVFSTPPTNFPSLKGGAVKCQILWTWCDYKCVFLPLISYHANNNTGCVVVRTWVYIRIVVGWLECKGEEEGRSNRDLIEWLPGKLLYSRFLPTTCRRPLAMPLESADVGEIHWAHCRAIYLPNAQIRALHICVHAVVRSGAWNHLPFHAPPTPIELEGSAKKLVVWKGKRLHQISIMDPKPKRLLWQSSAIHRSSSWQIKIRFFNFE